MGSRRTIQVITTATIVFTTLLPAATADACGLMDWLFGREETVAMMPVAAPTACAPQTIACSPPVQTCMRVVPETTYSTVWARKPVTTYRPVSSVDPCTGCQVTCMKPCTSYKYELQRVPHTTYRTEYVQSPVQGGSCCGNQYATAQSFLPNTTPMFGAATTQMAPSGCSSCSASNLPAGVPIPQTTYPTTVPGPAYPQTYYPEGQYPAGTIPSGTIPSGQPQPAMTMPSNGGYIPSGGAADQAPSLLQQRPIISPAPTQMQPLNPTPAQTQPGISSSSGYYPQYPITPAPAPAATNPGTTSSSLYGNDTLLEPPASASPANGGMGSGYGTGTGSSKSSIVTPIPDPDRPQIQRITPAIHPEDRSARTAPPQQTTWQVKLISWPEPSRTNHPQSGAGYDVHSQGAPNLTRQPQFQQPAATIPTLQPQAIPQRQQPVWDDSGWQSAR